MIEQQYILQQYFDLKSEPNIIRGATNNDLDEVKRALEADPNCINETEPNVGVTALHIAAFDGNYEMVDFLCDQPCIDIHKEDNLGRSPQWAAYIIGRNDIEMRIMRDMAAELDRILDAEEAEYEVSMDEGKITTFRHVPLRFSQLGKFI